MATSDIHEYELIPGIIQAVPGRFYMATDYTCIRQVNTFL